MASTSSPKADPTKFKVSEQDKRFLHDCGYDIARCIGSGQYGLVFNGVCNKYAMKLVPIKPEDASKTKWNVVKDPEKGQQFKQVEIHGHSCAVKMCDIKNWKEQVYYEAKNMQDFKHPNVVDMYLVCRTPNFVYIIMEYLNGGTLADYLARLAAGGDENEEESEEEDDGSLRVVQKMSQNAAIDMIRQITCGLLYLHTNNVIHGDFHRRNIMLSRNKKTLQFKIVDFGSSKPLADRNNIDDIRLLGCHIMMILDHSRFGNTDLRDNLDDIAVKMDYMQFQDINEVVEELSRYVSRISLQPEAQSSRFWSFFQKE